MPAPPRIARRLLDLLPHEHREHAIGDLVQEYERLAASGARLRARLWFWRETLGMLWALGGQWATFSGDVRRALRTLKRSPTFVVLASGTLAIGLGAMTAIFSVVDPLILRPLPYADASRLLMVWERGGGDLPSTTGYATYADFAQQSRPLESIAVNVGFDPEHVLSLQTDAVGPTYDPDPAVYALHARVLAAVRALPGVQHAAVASEIPLAGNLDQYGVEAQDKPLLNPELAPSADRYVVSSDFFETMWIPLAQGRTFGARSWVSSAISATSRSTRRARASSASPNVNGRGPTTASCSRSVSPAIPRPLRRPCAAR